MKHLRHWLYVICTSLINAGYVTFYIPEKKVRTYLNAYATELLVYGVYVCHLRSTNTVSRWHTKLKIIEYNTEQRLLLNSFVSSRSIHFYRLTIQPLKASTNSK